MKEQFPGYFRPTDKEFEELWKSAIIVLDASVLLNLYRYSEGTRKEFIRVLTAYQKRLWLPHRAVSEFFRNRLGVISQQADAYEEASKQLEKIEESFKNKRQHPFISEPLLERFIKVTEAVKRELISSKDAHAAQVSSDKILEETEKLFAGCVGVETVEAECAKICNEGGERYKRGLPPGYKDSAKDDSADNTRKFGDLILWKEILSKAKADKCSVIFVLDDRKEDWWLIHKGKTICPRPELIKEFKDFSGQSCYLYQPDSFLSYLNRHSKQNVSEPALNELKELRVSQDEKRLEEMNDRVGLHTLLSFKVAQLERKLMEITGLRDTLRFTVFLHENQVEDEFGGEKYDESDRERKLSELKAELGKVENEHLHVSAHIQEARKRLARIGSSLNIKTT